CVNPLAELLTDEINRKYYKKRAFLDRTYVKLNTSMIRAVDIKDIAGALETLLRIGGYTIDDILKTLGMEPLGTEWSTTRWMTKNYTPVETAITGGGK
ncbi:MAG: phage portal protein, partial [Bacillota bacterium]|nr:phage portal protein [Bacillota bacterium]